MIALLSIGLTLVLLPQAQSCADTKPAECPLFGHLGLCNDANIRVNVCPFTCGICTCKDAAPKGNCLTALYHNKCGINDPTTAAHHCRATCGLCSCVDKPSAVGCLNFLGQGQCIVNPVANFECPATCKLCGDCQDSILHCHARAHAGECGKADMMNGCRKSCKLCGESCEDATGMHTICHNLKIHGQCEVQKLASYTLCRKTCGHCQEGPIAKTRTAGTIEGKTVTLKDGRTRIHEFHKIRYAQAPVGHLRFRPPVRHIVPNQSVKVHASVEHHLKCIDASGSGTEDCLFLDVRTPDLHGSRPVIVWIHGGALKIGSGSDQGYSFDSEATSKADSVTVNVHYRLGFLGFSSVSELWDVPNGVYANNGIRDMIAALDWVQENIAAFGGNPNSVTIMGHSGGGTSVLALTCSPLAINKFHTALSLSPAPEMRATHVDGDKFQRQYVNWLGCAQPNPVDRKNCLLALPATSFKSGIFDPIHEGSAYFDFPMKNGPRGEAFGCIFIDPVVVTVNPRNLAHLKTQITPAAPIKIIIANQAEEITSPAKTEHEAHHAIYTNMLKLTNRHDIPQIVQHLYPKKNWRQILSLLLTDMRSTCPTNDVAEMMAHSKLHQVYRLYITHHSVNNRPDHNYSATFFFGGYLTQVTPLTQEAHQFAAHLFEMLKTLAWHKNVQNGWGAYPANSMVYEKSGEISRVIDEKPHQGICHHLGLLGLTKFGWQN